jgi:hypothetical protein
MLLRFDGNTFTDGMCMSEPFFKPEDFFDEFKDLKALAVFAANKANRLLQERGTVVYGFEKLSGPNYWSEFKDDDQTHVALLICVEPIAKDSAEKIVADFVELAERCKVVADLPGFWRLADRAKRLKGESK